MANGKRWTKEELQLVLNLYSRTAFGRLHQTNPDIRRLAVYLGRTPGSVAMKLCNFAAIDPLLPRAGLRGCSRLDHETWQEYFHNEEMIITSDRRLQSILQGTDAKMIIPETDFFAENKESFTYTRTRQNFFRDVVLSNFNDQCCITGINSKELLVASHIIPWTKDANNRLNPQNGLCLNALHDRAFDRGLITLDEALTVVVSKQLPRQKQLALILDYEGKKISTPDRFMPGKQFLEYHRDNIFQA